MMYVKFCHKCKNRYIYIYIYYRIRKKSILTSVQSNTNLKVKKCNLKPPPHFDMAGMALKGQCNLVSIMVPQRYL